MTRREERTFFFLSFPFVPSEKKSKVSHRAWSSEAPLRLHVCHSAPVSLQVGSFADHLLRINFGCSTQGFCASHAQTLSTWPQRQPSPLRALLSVLASTRTDFYFDNPVSFRRTLPLWQPSEHQTRCAEDIWTWWMIVFRRPVDLPTSESTIFFIILTSLLLTFPCAWTGCLKRSQIISDFTVEMTCWLLNMQQRADCVNIHNFQCLSIKYISSLACYKLLWFCISWYLYLPSAGLFHSKIHSYSAVSM